MSQEVFYRWELKKQSFFDKILQKDKKNTLVIDKSYLQCFIDKQLTEFYIPTLQECTILVLSQWHKLKNYPLAANDVQKIFIKNNEKEISLEQNILSPSDWKDFLLTFQTVFTELTLSFEEKIDQVYQKCGSFIQKDLQIESELLQNMGEIYESVYQAYFLDKKSKHKDEILQNPNVVFTYQRNGFEYYFLRNNFKGGVSKENIQIVENLERTAQENLLLVRNRMESYKNIQQKLLALKKEHTQKMKLRAVAEKLGNLQERNMQQGFNRQDLDFDTEVLGQLDILTENISGINTVEKSEILKIHIGSFREVFENDDRILKEINQKLRK